MDGFTETVAETVGVNVYPSVLTAGRQFSVPEMDGLTVCHNCRNQVLVPDMHG